MTAAPHDVSDLFLAPLVIALDERIDELGALDPDDLAMRVAIEGDRPASTREFRITGLLATVTHLIDLHHWEPSWQPRGIELSHGGRKVVLGVPASLTDFVSGASAAAHH